MPKQRSVIAAVIAAMILPLCLPAAKSPSLQSQPRRPVVIAPQIPSMRADDGNSVILRQSDRMYKKRTDSFTIVVGNVVFERGGMVMTCDSAHYYDSESFSAYGNVEMQQGDTLFIYADELQYRSYEQTAYLFADPGYMVRMIDNTTELLTPSFTYYLDYDIGAYTETGTLTDKTNQLYSIYGEYNTGTKNAFFTDNVVLRSLSQPDSVLADTLAYNTATHIALLFSNSRIYNENGTVYTDSAMYNTETDTAVLYKRSLVVMKSDGTTLQADTITYCDRTKYGEAFGNMVVNDSAKSIILMGDYGYYNNEVDSSYVTGHTQVKEFSQGDTLYLHAREIYSFARIDTVNIEADTLIGRLESQRLDTNHVIIARPRVRFYRSDMQGICDSMRFEQVDTTLYMYCHPVIWSDNRQIFGNVIQIHLNDSTIERASLPNSGFSAEHVDEEFYNQLSGSRMTAYFTNGEMTRLDVDGNVMAIMLPMEDKDSTYNKIINVESSFLSADFEGRNLLKMKMWPETSGTVTPLYLAPKSLFLLPGFKWYEGLRPLSPEDIFFIPPEMDALMEEP